MFEHVIFPASRWQMTQRSVHSAHPRGCAWTAGSFGGCTGDAAGASGTTPADGNPCWAGQFRHGGASAGRTATIKASAVMVLAMTVSDDVRGLQLRVMICAHAGFQPFGTSARSLINHLKWEIGSRGALSSATAPQLPPGRGDHVIVRRHLPVQFETVERRLAGHRCRVLAVGLQLAANTAITGACRSRS
jgi:hypothetical protein